MKANKPMRYLLIFLFSFLYAQTDHLSSQIFSETYDQILHIGNNDSFGSGLHIVERSDADKTTVDTSAFAVSDSVAGTRASGMGLLIQGDTTYVTAADLDLLLGLSDHSILYDSSNVFVNAPRTIYGWSHDLTFSASDHNTIAWTSGSLYFTNLDTFSIVSGNTGNISAITWIYFYENASSTVLQTTTSGGSAVGNSRIVICVGENVVSTKSAAFQVFGNSGQSSLIGTTQIEDNSITTGLILANTILAGDIAANTITGNEILGNSLGISEINFSTVPSDTVITQINGGGGSLFVTANRLQIAAATTFATGYDPSDGSFTIYQLAAPTTRPSGDALQNGDAWIDSTVAQGNIPKVWTGSQWRTAFTFINGGYIKTGVIDANVIRALGSDGSGQRIEINADDNNRLIFYDSGGNEIVRIGEDIRGSVDGLNVSNGAVQSSQGSGLSYMHGAVGGFQSTTGDILIDGTVSQIFFNSEFRLRRLSANVLQLLDANLDMEGNLITNVSTLNTGQGANELYDMDQNVLTSSEATFTVLNATSRIDITERASVPTHEASIGKLWVKNDTSAPLRYTTDDDQDLYVVTAIARTTLPGTTWEGRIVIDTDDNIAYIYADGGWRIIASGW